MGERPHRRRFGITLKLDDFVAKMARVLVAAVGVIPDGDACVENHLRIHNDLAIGTVELFVGRDEQRAYLEEVGFSRRQDSAAPSGRCSVLRCPQESCASSSPCGYVPPESLR